MSLLSISLGKQKQSKETAKAALLRASVSIHFVCPLITAGENHPHSNLKATPLLVQQLSPARFLKDIALAILPSPSSLSDFPLFSWLPTSENKRPTVSWSHLHSRHPISVFSSTTPWSRSSTCCLISLHPFFVTDLSVKTADIEVIAKFNVNFLSLPYFIYKHNSTQLIKHSLLLETPFSPSFQHISVLFWGFLFCSSLNAPSLGIIASFSSFLWPLNTPQLSPWTPLTHSHGIS